MKPDDPASGQDQQRSLIDQQTKKPTVSEPIASKWNARYAFANNEHPDPASVLTRGSRYLPSEGYALDLACGRAGNALYLAKRGFKVDAWDISSAVVDWVSAYRDANWPELDLSVSIRDVIKEPPPVNTYDVVVVSRFLHRELCEDLASTLKSGGVLFYQTFTAGLSNKDYLLEPNELPTLFPSLMPCLYEETSPHANGRAEALFVASKTLLKRV